MKRIVATLLLLTSFLSVHAYDFHKSIGGGNRLYFHILDDASVEVVCPNDVYGNPYGDFLKPIGRVRIPATVVYEGVTYTVVAIDNHAFEGCDDMKAVVIPHSVRRIGAAAFRDCHSLRSVCIDAVYLDEVDMPFMGCEKLDSLIIGEGVHTIPSFAFSDMDYLKVVLFNAELPERMRNIFYGSLAGVALVVGPKVTAVPDGMCSNFPKLKTIVWKGGVERIGKEAFYYCAGLDSIALPPTLQQLDDYAFAFSAPGRIGLRCREVPVMGLDPFMGVDARTYVVVPCGMRDEWLASVVGRHFDRLYYPANCQQQHRTGEEPDYVRDTVYIHDTVWLHDTIYIRDTAIVDDEDEADSLQYYVESKTLILENIQHILNKSYILYDNNGRIVDKGIIPATAVDRYAIRLPRRKRCYLQLQGMEPISVTQ